MALDPSIILQAGNYKTPDYATTLAQVGQIRAQQDASKLQAVQLARLSRQDAAEAEAMRLKKAAGAQYASGDSAGAISTAATGGDFDLVKTFQSLDDDQRKRIHGVAVASAPILFTLKKLPPDQRAAAFQATAPDLKTAGMTDAQIAQIGQNVGNDAYLDHQIANGQTIEQLVAQDQKDRDFKFEGVKFNHTVEKDKAELGLKKQEVALSGARLNEERRHNRETESGSDGTPLLTDDAIESQAQQVAAGGDLPALGLGKTSAALKAKILNRAAEIQKANGNDGGSMVLVKAARQANQAALKDLTKRNGVMSAAKNTALANGQLLVESAGKGAGTTGSPIINRWQQAYRNGVQGSPDVAQFGLAINTFANEYAKVVSGATGSAAVAEGARQEMLHHLSTASTPEQVAAIVRQAKKEMASSTNSLQSQIGETRKALSTGGQRAPAPAPASHPADIAALLKKYGK